MRACVPDAHTASFDERKAQNKFSSSTLFSRFRQKLFRALGRRGYVGSTDKQTCMYVYNRRVAGYKHRIPETLHGMKWATSVHKELLIIYYYLLNERYSASSKCDALKPDEMISSSGELIRKKWENKQNEVGTYLQTR